MSINILIVEDVSNKITALGEAIKEKVEVEIFPKNDEMDNFIELLSNAAKESSSSLEKWIDEQLIMYLDNNDIDLIILDFYLYKNEEKGNSRADNASGYKILSKIRNSNAKNIPIFANSFKNAGIVAINDSILSTIDGILEKKSTKSEYDGYFKRNIFLINRMVTLAESYKKEKIKSDIVVICALQKELKAVLSLDCQWEDFIHDGKEYYKGKLSNKKIIATTENKMGMSEAASVTTRVIYIFKPKYVVMTGIAAGVDSEEQKPLDILMPTYVHNWQSGKYTIKKGDTEKEGDLYHIFDRNYDSIDTYFKIHGVSVKEDDLKKISKKFLEIEGLNFEDNKFEAQIAIDYINNIIGEKIQTERSEFQKELIKLEIEKKKKQQNIIKPLSEEDEMELETSIEINQESPSFLKLKVFYERLECRIHNEGMVSGSAVVADGELVDENIKSKGVKGIDMEVHGVAHACISANIKAIIIKSICDFANDEKNDVYQSAAAYVSAQVFYKLFTEYIDVELKS